LGYMCTKTSVRRRPGGQLTETPEDRLGQTISCLVLAALRHRGQRAFIDEGVTRDLPGRRRAVEIQQRLPVQRDGMTLVDLLAAGRRGVPIRRNAAHNASRWACQPRGGVRGPLVPPCVSPAGRAGRW